MKKKDREFFREMKRDVMNQVMTGIAIRSSDNRSDKTEGLQGEEYVEAVRNAEKADNYIATIEYKQLEQRILELAKSFKELKSTVKNPAERIGRMEEKWKFLKEELKESRRESAKLNKRVKELEKAMLFLIRQTPFRNCSTVADFNKEAKYFERGQVYGDMAEIFKSNMIEGGKY